MTSEIDRLMELDPLELSSTDIEKLISYHRNTLEAYELGMAKPKKGEATQELDLIKLGLVKKKPPIVRRA